MTLRRETRARLLRDLLARGSDQRAHLPSRSERFLRYAVTLLLIVLALYLFAQL